MDETPLVRLHYIIGRNEGPRRRSMCASWNGRSRELLTHLGRWPLPMPLPPCMGRAEGAARLAALRPHFSPGYRDNFPAHEARGGSARSWRAWPPPRTGLRLRASVWRKRR